MKRACIIFILILGACASLFAQNGQRHSIAVFAPLYLDSAYDESNAYRFGTTFPKYINAGLEFYQGAQMALDSLSRAGAALDVYVYDTRSAKTPLNQELNHPDIKNVELIIGSTSSAESRVIAEAALRKKVPFISSSLPNDAGVLDNPYYVVLNSTLRTHCESLYRYLQKNNSLDNVVFFTKTGTQETMVKEYFEEYRKATTGIPLNIAFETIGNDFDEGMLEQKLDSTRKNVFIAGSLDETFGVMLVQSLAAVESKYQLTVVGMPTWDNMNFPRETKKMDVVYTTPFYYAKATPLSTKITNEFTTKQTGKPTDMFYRGYETVLYFTRLLLDNKKDVASNLIKKGTPVFTPFDIQPVFINKGTPTLDYFENKHLYFVKVINGVRTIQ